MLTRNEFMKSSVVALVGLLLPKPVVSFVKKHAVKAIPSKFTGNVWFVDSENGNDSYDGRTPHSAFATKGAAIAAVHSAHDKRELENHDAVFCLPDGGKK